jgi:manganese transport protein
MALPPDPGNGWNRQSPSLSLGEMHGSVPISRAQPAYKRFLAFIGPGYLVAVGYMDPGNWATSLSGGARFGYSLLCVILFSNLMAVLLQSFAARLAIASGRDLAQACRDQYSIPVTAFLWLMAELAIIATDLAEVIGTAIGLKLLFGLPLTIGIVLTACDVFLLLALQHYGFRRLEALVMSLMALVAGSMIAQIILVQPDWAGVLQGFIPTTDLFVDADMLYLSMGIIGATVMPHNLFLHSGIVQTRQTGHTDAEKAESLRFANLDSAIALTFALFINAAILILAAKSFHWSGHSDVTEIEEAHGLLASLLGSQLAPVLFALALIGCGLNSTVTATLAGQIVMEGFLAISMPAWARRLVTRLMAIVPAVMVGIMAGDRGTSQLLVLSQVILGLQLPFAMVPLLLFVADRRKMGALTAPFWQILVGFGIAALIIILNLKLSFDLISGL